MFSYAGKLLLKCHLLLLALAAGGIIGAGVAGFVPALGEFTSNPRRAPDPHTVRSWVHGGWIAGAAAFFLAALARMLRAPHSNVPTAAKRPDTTPGTTPPSRTIERIVPHRVRLAARSRRRSGILSSAAAGAFFGALIGLSVGGSLLLLWFSLAYSPLAPDGWASSITTRDVGPGTLRRERAITTDHPLALYAFGGPIALGALGGALFCGAGAAVEQWKHPREHDNRRADKSSD